MAFAIADADSKLYKKTQSEFDEITINNFRRDKERGTILYYKILEDLKMILKHYYKNAVPVGVYPLCNFGGLAILAIDGEKAVAAFNWGEGYKQIRRHTIFYTYTGRAYIRKAGQRYYFDQITRINGGN